MGPSGGGSTEIEYIDNGENMGDIEITDLEDNMGKNIDVILDGLEKHLLTDASIEEVKGIMLTTVCALAPDPYMCEISVKQYWTEISGCIFPEIIGGSGVCDHLGLCKTPIMDTGTCDDCTDIMAKIATYIMDPTTMASANTVLQGECLCGTIDAHSTVCSTMLDQLLPPGMTVISGYLTQVSSQLCQIVTGVC